MSDKFIEYYLIKQSHNKRVINTCAIPKDIWNKYLEYLKLFPRHQGFCYDGHYTDYSDKNFWIITIPYYLKTLEVIDFTERESSIFEEIFKTNIISDNTNFPLWPVHKCIEQTWEKSLSDEEWEPIGEAIDTIDWEYFDTRR